MEAPGGQSVRYFVVAWCVIMCFEVSLVIYWGFIFQ